LSPRMFVTRDKAGKLYMWTIVDVAIGEWKGRYSSLSAARPGMIQLAQGLGAEESKQLEADLVASYAKALQTFDADAQGSLTEFAPRKVQIEALSPRFSAKVKYEHVLEREGNLVVRALDPQANLVAGFGFTGTLVVDSSMVQL